MHKTNERNAIFSATRNSSLKKVSSSISSTSNIALENSSISSTSNIALENDIASESKKNINEFESNVLSASINNLIESPQSNKIEITNSPKNTKNTKKDEAIHSPKNSQKYPSLVIRPSLKSIKLGIKRRRKYKQYIADKYTTTQNSTANVSSKSGNDKENSEIEVLQRVFQKSSFGDMHIAGQFNLGFIIARLKSDIFILDQHACDEKYNFENLQKSTEIHEQNLIQPLDMKLTVVEEITIKENIEIFKKNGFRLRVIEDAEPGQQLRLLSVPYSKKTLFGVEDVHELASLLRESPALALGHRTGADDVSYVRLPKLIAMYASRACRTSIMIGSALSRQQMQKILYNLTTLNQPWNCPHGRPTMRHLADLNKLAVPRRRRQMSEIQLQFEEDMEVDIINDEVAI
eukprot:GSMAST32.ASY1.ANO1.289.1 assembled CDS